MAVKVAIAGVGNCANSLVQGVTFYADAEEGARIPGLMHNRLGPHAVGDIEFVAAFDVDALKVGVDLAEAIWASQNSTFRFAEVAVSGVTVQRGPTLDGLGDHYRELVDESDEPVVDVARVLRDSGADVLVCYVPVGSEQAARFYAQAALDAGVAFVNALPVFIASDPAWAAKFEAAGVPIIGINEVTPLSMASAYAGVAALGKWCKPIIVDSIVTPDGESKVGQTPECKQAIPQNIAATAIDVLKGVMVSGNQVYGNPEDGIPLFGKTGTTDVGEQTWVATGTTSGGSVVWVGNSVGKVPILDQEYEGVAGIRLRHYISLALVTALDNKYGGNDWPAPDPSLVTGGGLAVPDVRGLTPESAKALLEGLGFTYKDGGPVDSEVPAGKVATTDPAPGSNSGKGATITVFTSKGNKVAFPDVVLDGETNDFTTAEGQLNTAGYMNVTQTCVVITPTTGNPPMLPTDPKYGRLGKVQSSTPAPGSYNLPGTPVTLAVGKETCP